MISPHDEGCHIYRERDVRNLGYVCIAPDCLRKATMEIGIQGEVFGNDIMCLCDEHVDTAIELFFEQRGDGEPTAIEGV